MNNCQQKKKVAFEQAAFFFVVYKTIYGKPTNIINTGSILKLIKGTAQENISDQ
jgi:hypothetical protein